MTPQQRHRGLLAALAGVLVLVAILRLGDDDSGVGNAPTASTSRIRGSQAAEQALVDRVVDLDLAALAPKPGHVEIGRNPFRFGAKPAPPAPPRLAPRPDPIEPPKPIEPPPPVDLGPQPPSADHLAYLGSFGPRSGQIAVIRGRDDIWTARAGDVLEDQFIVKRIGLESIDIGFVGFPDAPIRRLGLGG